MAALDTDQQRDVSQWSHLTRQVPSPPPDGTAPPDSAWHIS